MLKSISLLLQMILFTLIATAMFAAIQHLSATFVYNFKLRDDWKYALNDNSLLTLLEIGLIFFSIASGILYIIMLFANSMTANTRWLILVLIVTLMVVALNVGVNRFVDLFSIRALTQLIIYLIPTVLTRYIPRGTIVMNNQTV